MLRIKKSGKVIVKKCRFIVSSARQSKGLMGTKSLKGAAIFPFAWPRREIITTWFMRYPIDIVLCNGKGSVVELKQEMKPWRWYLCRKSASWLIELPSGTIKAKGLAVGMLLELAGERFSF